MKQPPFGGNLIAGNARRGAVPRASGSSRWPSVGLAALALGLVGLALAVTSPLLQPLPGRDSSVYLHAGHKMLSGSRLYVDVWDHKGPLVHHLNAVALLLGEGFWGLWGVRAIFLLLTAACAVVALSRSFSPGAAAAALVVAFAPLGRLLEGGNMVEEYALLSAWGGMAVLAQGRHALGGPTWHAAAVGFLTAASGLLRPNLVMTSGVVGAWLVFFSPRRTRQALALLLGGGLLGGGVALVLAWRGGLAAAIDAVWFYNLAYTRLRGPFYLIDSFERFRVALPLLGVVGLAWVSVLLGMHFRKAGDLRPSPLLGAALFAFPLEVAMATLSGRPYRHYLLALLPAAAVVTAGAWDRWRGAKGVLRWLAVGVAAFGLYTAGQTVRAPVTFLAKAVLGIGDDALDQARGRAAELRSLATRATPLWVWGNEASAYLLSGRLSSVPYGYAYPLLTPTARRAEWVARTRQALCRTRPEILDASRGNPVVPPLPRLLRQGWQSTRPAYQLSPELVALLDFVAEYWRATEKLPHTGWVVWLPPPAEILDHAPQCREAVAVPPG